MKIGSRAMWTKRRGLRSEGVKDATFLDIEVTEMSLIQLTSRDQNETMVINAAMNEEFQHTFIISN